MYGRERLRTVAIYAHAADNAALSAPFRGQRWLPRPPPAEQRRRLCLHDESCTVNAFNDLCQFVAYRRSLFTTIAAHIEVATLIDLHKKFAQMWYGKRALDMNCRTLSEARFRTCNCARDAAMPSRVERRRLPGSAGAVDPVATGVSIVKGGRWEVTTGGAVPGAR